MNSMQLYQSFQYAIAENSDNVASSGLLSGSIKLKKIRKSVAPSIVPDSVIEAGIPFIKVFAIIMFHTENSIGRINAKILFSILDIA